MQQPPNQPPFDQPGQEPPFHPHSPQGYQQPPMQQFPQAQPLKKKRRRWLLITIIAAVVIFGCIIFSTGFHDIGKATPAALSTSEPTHQAAPTNTPASTAPPAPPSVQYPPKTEADLHGLAVHGDANAIHEFHSETVGLAGVCPQSKRLVIVDSGVKGQQLAEDVLAYFYAQRLENPCGSIVFAYYTQAEANDPNGGAYTAGRVMLNVTDSSGSLNTDPNASNLKRTITLDTGGFDANQEYVVSY